MQDVIFVVHGEYVLPFIVTQEHFPLFKIQDTFPTFLYRCWKYMITKIVYTRKCYDRDSSVANSFYLNYSHKKIFLYFVEFIENLERRKKNHSCEIDIGKRKSIIAINSQSDTEKNALERGFIYFRSNSNNTGCWVSFFRHSPSSSIHEI